MHCCFNCGSVTSHFSGVQQLLQPLGEHWFSSATRQDFSTLEFTPNSGCALPTPATSQWPKAKETPQTPSLRTWLPFKSPPQLEQREIVILFIWSAPVQGGSPVGHWATVQMVPLPSDLLSVGLGFFHRRLWGDSGNEKVALVWGAGLIMGQRRTTQSKEDS